MLAVRKLHHIFRHEKCVWEQYGTDGVNHIKCDTHTDRNLLHASQIRTILYFFSNLPEEERKRQKLWSKSERKDRQKEVVHPNRPCTMCIVCDVCDLIADDSNKWLSCTKNSFILLHSLVWLAEKEKKWNEMYANWSANIGGGQFYLSHHVSECDSNEWNAHIALSSMQIGIWRCKRKIKRYSHTNRMSRFTI